ncbi:unnamed protein product [Medioppia subpectinata]|uniref:Uncharacterized protein n=1 Tax=Medioppia subpectinata TaxID=1979941 RepID=A0A7R9PVB0_9ACAR|nr:unnamed protein product [Medioppia subpectinata]CAG2102487.1 unnamed protein product [Medioppia subpectinata]
MSYARQLAHKRYNLLLISRSADKLEKVRNDLQVIQQPLNTTTKVLNIDFTINTDEVYDRIDRELQAMDIHVLINNVGMYCPDGVPRNFIDVPELNKYNQDIINVNIIACTRLTTLILPAMIHRGRGVIINLSSFGATFPYPQLAVYSATKVYVDYFSRALEAESLGTWAANHLPVYLCQRPTALLVRQSEPLAARAVLLDISFIVWFIYSTVI